MARINCQHSDVQLIHHQPTAGHAEQLIRIGKTDTKPTGIDQFPTPLLLTPEPTGAALIQSDASGKPADIEIEWAHGCGKSSGPTS